MLLAFLRVAPLTADDSRPADGSPGRPRSVAAGRGPQCPTRGEDTTGPARPEGPPRPSAHDHVHDPHARPGGGADRLASNPPWPCGRSRVGRLLPAPNRHDTPAVWPAAYHYQVLDPRPQAPLPDGLAPDRTLGIEVTAAHLARLCGLGNLDPQHTGGDPGTAAIQAALIHPLPPAGSLLATIRPDLDALGAMATLELRRQGPLSEATRHRIDRIAEVDRHEHGPWPGPRPLPAPDDDEPPGPLAILADVAADRHLALTQRVGTLRAWLATGSLPADAEDRSRRIRAARAAAVQETSLLEVRGQATIAAIQGTHRLGVSLGYRTAPVVVAENPEYRLSDGPPHRKLTIAQYQPGWVDLGGVIADLNRREPGWGGSPTICGSPQGIPCQTPRDTVLDIVEAHLLRRVAPDTPPP